MEDLVLTDDEVIALSVLEGTSWPAPLPTVDITQEGALDAAGRRGARSLAVRGYLDDDGIDEELHAFLQPALSHQVRQGVFVAESDMTYIAEGLTMMNYERTDLDCLVEVIGYGGVHYFSVAQRSDCAELVRTLLQQTIDEGLSTPRNSLRQVPAAEYLCVTGQPQQGARVVLAWRGGVAVKQVPPDGGPLRDLPSVDSVETALGLLAAVSS